MVSRDGVDIAALYRFPDSVLGFLALHGRRAYEVPAVRALVDIAGEFQVLRTGFCVDLVALVLCLGHGFDALLVRQMDYVQRSVGCLCKIDRALVRFALDEFRTAHVVIPRVSLALADVFFGQGIYQFVVLRVDRDQRAELLGFCEQLVEHAVLHAEVIHHEHLVGSHADIAGVLYAVQQFAVDILDADVERVIHRRVGSRESVPALEGLGHSFVEIL